MGSDPAGKLGARNIEVVRTLHEKVIGADIAGFVRAVVEAQDWGDLIARLPQEAKVSADLIDPAVEIDARHLDLPFGGAGHWMGQEGWLEVWRTWLEPWDEFSFVASNFEATGDDVLMDVSITAMGRESRAPVDSELSQIWTVREGRIAGMRPFLSRRDALAALETKPLSDDE